MKKINKFLIKTLLLLLTLPIFVSFGSKENGQDVVGSFSTLRSELSAVELDHPTLKDGAETGGGTHVHEFTAEQTGDGSVRFTCNATGCDLPGKNFAVEIEAADADYTGAAYDASNITIKGIEYVEEFFGGYSIIYEQFNPDSAQYENPTSEAPYKTGNYRVAMSFSTTENGDFVLTDIFKINHVHHFAIVAVEGSESKLAAICSDDEDNPCSLAGKTSIISLDAKDFIADGSAYPSDTKVTLSGRDAIVSVTGSYSPLFEYYTKDGTKLEHLPSEEAEYYVTCTFGTTEQGGPWILKDGFRIVNDHEHVFKVDPVDGDPSSAVIYCANTETPCELEGQTFTVSIAAANATYTGNYYSLTNITLPGDSADWIKTVNYETTITYQFYAKSDTSFSNPYINPPVALGEYVVRVVVDNIYIQSEFEIYHQHDLSFTFNGDNSATITCNNAALCCSIPDGSFTVTLNATDQAYTGNPYDVSNIEITGSENVLDLIKDINESDNITYYFSLQSASTSTPTSTLAPTELGDYYVYIYLTDKVIKAPFSITHTHDFTYTYDAGTLNQLEVICNALGCPDFSETVTFVLEAEDYVFDGEQYNPSLVTINDLDKAVEIDGIEAVNRQLYFYSDLAEDPLTNPPTDIGTYYAVMTIGSYNLTSSFEIYHEHIFSATVDGSNPAKATVICSSPGCPLIDSKFEVIISADDLEYDGNAYSTSNITITNDDLLKELVLDGADPTFEYALQSDGIYGSIAPKDIGSYYVRTTFLTKTIYTTFEIKHTHEFTYEKVDNTIEISCSNPTGCDFGGTKVITLTADSVAFTGYAYDVDSNVHIVNEDIANELGSIALSYASSSTPDNKSATPPTDKGNYICYLTFTYNGTSTLEISDAFVIDHTHDFKVTATSGSNTATVTCLNEGCDLNDGTGSFQVVISATQVIQYAGNPVELSNFTVSNKDDAKLANGGDLVFEFAKTGGISPSYSTTPPTDKGTYYVRVKIKDKYIQTTFKIDHTHSYVVTVTAQDTLTITCSNPTGCTLGTKTVKIVASDAQNTGNAYNENTYLSISNAIDASVAASALGLEIDQYYTTKAAPAVRLDSIPADVGEYYACYAIGTYLIKDEFKIYHNHNFQLAIDSSNPAKLDVHCANEPCELDDFSIVITGPGKFEYTGNPIDTTQLVISNLDLAELVNGGTLSKFFYNKDSKSTTTNPPTDKGNYQYQVKVGGKTLKYDFTIEHTHDFVLAQFGNAFQLSCSNPTGCDYTLTFIALNANSKEYDANPYSASNYSISNLEALVDAGFEYTVSYATQANPDTTIDAPINIGSYIMYLEANGLKQSSTFTIYHTHDLHYEYDGTNKVTITCTNTTGCDIPHTGIVLTITANDDIYTGNVYLSSNVTVTGLEDLYTYLEITPTQSYAVVTPNTNTLPPKASGTYKAVLTGTGFEIYDTFTIEGEHKHGEQVYLPWTSTSTLPASGYYYLLDNVTLSSEVTISSNLHLCLNGHSVLTTDGITIDSCNVYFESCNGNGFFKPAGESEGALINSVSGELYFSNITITNYVTESRLIDCDYATKVSFDGCTIEENIANGIIYMEDNALYLEDTTITYNENPGDSYNLYMIGSIVVFSGEVNITDNYADTNNTAYPSNLYVSMVMASGPCSGEVYISVLENGVIESTPSFYTQNEGVDPSTMFYLEDEVYESGTRIHYNDDNLLEVSQLPVFILNENAYAQFYYDDSLVNGTYFISTELSGAIHFYAWSTVRDDPSGIVEPSGQYYTLSDFEYGKTYYGLFQNIDEQFVHTYPLFLGTESISGEGYTYTYDSDQNKATLVLNNFHQANFNLCTNIYCSVEGLELTIEVYNSNAIEALASWLYSANHYRLIDCECSSVIIKGCGNTDGSSLNSLDLCFRGLFAYDPINDEEHGFSINDMEFIGTPIVSVTGVSSTNPLHISMTAYDVSDYLDVFFIQANEQAIRSIEFKNVYLETEIYNDEPYLFDLDNSDFDSLIFTNSTIIDKVYASSSDTEIMISTVDIKIDESTITHIVESDYDVIGEAFTNVSSSLGEGHNITLFYNDEEAVSATTFAGEDYQDAYYLSFTTSFKFYNSIFDPEDYVYSSDASVTESFLNPTLEQYSIYLAYNDSSDVNRGISLVWLDDNGSVVTKAGDKYTIDDFSSTSSAYYLTIINEDCGNKYVPYMGYTYEDLKAYAKGQESSFAKYAPFYPYGVTYTETASLETLVFGPITYIKDLLNENAPIVVAFADDTFVDVLTGAFNVTSEANVIINLGNEGNYARILSTVPTDNYYIVGIATLSEEEKTTLKFLGSGELDVQIWPSNNNINNDKAEYYAIAYMFSEVEFMGNDGCSSVNTSIDIPFGFAAVGGRFDLDTDYCELKYSSNMYGQISMKASVILLPSKLNINGELSFNLELVDNAYFDENFESFDHAIYIATSIVDEVENSVITSNGAIYFTVKVATGLDFDTYFGNFVEEGHHEVYGIRLNNQAFQEFAPARNASGEKYGLFGNFNEDYKFTFDFEDDYCYAYIVPAVGYDYRNGTPITKDGTLGHADFEGYTFEGWGTVIDDPSSVATTLVEGTIYHAIFTYIGNIVYTDEIIISGEENVVLDGLTYVKSTNTLTINNFVMKTFTGRGLSVPAGCVINYKGTNTISVVSANEEYMSDGEGYYEYNGYSVPLTQYDDMIERVIYGIHVGNGEWDEYAHFCGDGLLVINVIDKDIQTTIGDYIVVDELYAIDFNADIRNESGKEADLIINVSGGIISCITNELANSGANILVNIDALYSIYGINVYVQNEGSLTINSQVTYPTSVQGFADDYPLAAKALGYYTDINFLYTANDQIIDTMRYNNAYKALLESYEMNPRFIYCGLFPYAPAFTNVSNVEDLNGNEFATRAVGDLYSSTDDDKYTFGGIDLYSANEIIPVSSGAIMSFTLKPVLSKEGDYLVIDNFAYSYDSESGEFAYEDENGIYVGYALYKLENEEYVKVIDFCPDTEFIIPTSGTLNNGAKFGPFLDGTYKVAVTIFDGEEYDMDYALFSDPVTITNALPIDDAILVSGYTNITFYTDYLSYREFAQHLKEIDRVQQAYEEATDDQEKTNYANQLIGLNVMSENKGIANFVKVGSQMYRLTDDTVITGSFEGAIYTQALNINATFEDLYVTLKSNLFSVGGYPTYGLEHLPEKYNHVNEVNLTVLGSNEITISNINACNDNDVLCATGSFELTGTGELTLDTNTCPFDTVLSVEGELELKSHLRIALHENNTAIETTGSLGVQGGALDVNIVAASAKEGNTSTKAILEIGKYVIVDNDYFGYIYIEADKKVAYEQNAINCEILQVNADEENSYLFIKNTYSGVYAKTYVMFDSTSLYITVTDTAIKCDSDIAIFNSDIYIEAANGIFCNLIDIDGAKENTPRIIVSKVGIKATEYIGIYSNEFNISGTTYTNNAALLEAPEVYFYGVNGIIDGFAKGIQAEGITIENSELLIKFGTSAINVTGDGEAGEPGLFVNTSSVTLTPNGNCNTIVDATGYTVSFKGAQVYVNGQNRYAIKCSSFVADVDSNSNPSNFESTGGIFADSVDIKSSYLTFNLCQTSTTAIYSKNNITVNNSTLDIKFEVPNKTGTYGLNAAKNISVKNSTVNINNFLSGLYSLNNITVETTKLVITSVNEAVIATNQAGIGTTSGSKFTGTGEYKSGVKGKTVFITGILEITGYQTGVEAVNAMTISGADLTITAEYGLHVTTEDYSLVLVNDSTLSLNDVVTGISDIFGDLNASNSTITMQAKLDGADLYPGSTAVETVCVYFESTKFVFDDFTYGFYCYESITFESCDEESVIDNCFHGIDTYSEIIISDYVLTINSSTTDSLAIYSEIGEISFAGSEVTINGADTGIKGVALTITNDSEVTIEATYEGILLFGEAIITVANSELEVTATAGNEYCIAITASLLEAQNSDITINGFYGANVTDFAGLQSNYVFNCDKLCVQAETVYFDTCTVSNTAGTQDDTILFSTLEFEAYDTELNLVGDYVLTANEITLNGVSGSITANKVGLGKLYSQNTNNTNVTLVNINNFVLTGNGNSVEAKTLTITDAVVVDTTTKGVKVTTLKVNNATLNTTDLEAESIDLEKGLITAQNLKTTLVYNSGNNFFVVNNATRVDGGEDVFKVALNSENGHFELEGAIDATMVSGSTGLEIRTLNAYLASDGTTRVTTENAFEITGEAVFGNALEDIITEAEKVATDYNTVSVPGIFTLALLEDIHAGENTYRITFTSTDNKIKDVFILEGTIDISKKVIEIDWCEDDFTYNEEEQEITATYKDVNGNDVALTVTVDPETFKDAGDYLATASFANNETNYELPALVTKSYTIKKFVITIDWCEDDFTYNEEEQEITASYQNAKDETVSLTITVDPSTFKEVGLYLATASFANSEDNNYALPEEFVEQYTMKAFVVEITWTEDNFTYDGQEHVVTATYVDAKGNVINLSVALDNTPFKDAGDYVATASFANNETGYALPDVTTKSYTIKPCVIYIRWCEDDFTYNEQEQTITATYLDVTAQSVNLVVSVDPSLFKEAGTYTATASFANNETNYVLPEENTKQYHIKKKDVTVTWSEDDYSYNGQEQAVTATYTNALGVTVPLYITYSETFLNAGTYTVTAAFANNETSYNITNETSKEYHIKKIDYDMSGISFNDLDVVEEDGIKEIKVTGTLPTGYDGKTVTVTYSGNPSDAVRGKYTITATFATDSSNYNVPDSMQAILSIKWTKSIYEDGKVVVESEYGIDPSIELVVKPITIDKSLKTAFKSVEGFGKNDELVVGYEIYFAIAGIKTTLPNDVTIKVLYDESLVDQEAKVFFDSGNSYKEGELNVVDGYIVFASKTGNKVLEVYSHYTLTWVMVSLGGFIGIEVVWLVKLLEKKKRLELMRGQK